LLYSIRPRSAAKRLAATMAGSCLLACGGSGSTAVVQDGYVLTAGADGSGLPFAAVDGPDDLSGLSVGDTIKIRYVRYEDISGTPQLVTSTETITVIPDTLGGGGFDLQTTLDDTTVDLDVDVAFLPELYAVVVLPDEEFIAIDPSELGAYSTVYQLYSSAPSRFIGTRQGYFALGFNTDPETVADKSGTAEFGGDFLGQGAVLDADNEVIRSLTTVRGDIDLSVDFSNGSISGEISSGQIGGLGGELRAIRGSIPETTINRNTFQTALPDIVCNGLSCASDSAIGGGFYGPNADEVTGIITFDVTGTDEFTGTTERFISAAGFVAQDP